MKAIARILITSTALIAAVGAFGAQKGHHAKITAAQAQKTALAKYPGKVQGKVELENEDGKWQYAVVVRSGKKLREVMVDAKTGKIASVENTSAAEEAREAAADKKAAAKHKKGKKG